MTTHIDPFVTRLREVLNRLEGYRLEEGEIRRTEFQNTIRTILKEDRNNFFFVGEASYYLEPSLKSDRDWRRRDINRLLTRHREDRPIEDARRWALFALFIALIALTSSFVSAVADFPTAWGHLREWSGAAMSAPAPKNESPPQG